VIAAREQRPDLGDLEHLERARHDAIGIHEFESTV
jgi:hypothetical protein